MTTAVADPGTGNQSGTGAGDNGGVDWKAGLPDTLTTEHGGAMVRMKELPMLANIKSIGDLTKGYVEAQKLIGGSVRIPAADAPKEEIDKFHAKLGRPETADKYQFKYPEGVQADAALEKRFKDKAYSLGLNPTQAQTLIDFHHESQQIAMHQSGLTPEKAEAILKQEWGEKFDSNYTIAERALAALEMPGLADVLKKTGLGNHPDVIKGFHKIGLMLLEDEGMAGISFGDNMTTEEADKRINTIRNDAKHPYHNSAAPGHKEALAEMRALYEFKHRGA